MKKNGMRDGAGGTRKRRLTARVPAGLMQPLREAAAKADTDKAKFVRQAIREKFARAGIKLAVKPGQRRQAPSSQRPNQVAA